VVTIALKHRRFLLGTVVPILSRVESTQAAPADKPPPAVIVFASRVLDVHCGRYLQAGAAHIEGARIESIGPAQTVMAQAPAEAIVVDLHDPTFLPGLIDCHTHLMPRIPEGEDACEVNLLTKSEAYRALEGAANARATLQAGFTTVRDVENEGSGYADVALRDAINAGLVEGPRMLVATRGIAAVGQYPPFNIRPLMSAQTWSDFQPGLR